MKNCKKKFKGDLKGSSNRTFGLLFFIIFFISSGFLYPSTSNIEVLFFVVACVFLFLSIVAPKTLAPANSLWTKFVKLLHYFVSPIALGVMYFIFITPMWILMRLLGKDLLLLRQDPKLASYWIERTPPGPNEKSFNNQF